jgi:hypothetical protein
MPDLANIPFLSILFCDAERDALCSEAGLLGEERQITIHKLYLNFKRRIPDPAPRKRGARLHFSMARKETTGVQNAREL